MTGESGERVDPATYTAGKVRHLLLDWGMLRRGELGYPARLGDAADLGTTILAAHRGSRPPVRVELLDVDAAVARLGPFERRVTTLWYADGLGLADPFEERDILATPPNVTADREGADNPAAGDLIGHALGWHWGGRRLTGADVWGARNRAVERVARALRATSLDPDLLPARTNLAEVFAGLSPEDRRIVDLWLSGRSVYELARMFDRPKTSLARTIRRFRAQIVVVGALVMV